MPMWGSREGRLWGPYAGLMCSCGPKFHKQFPVPVNVITMTANYSEHVMGKSAPPPRRLLSSILWDKAEVTMGEYSTLGWTSCLQRWTYTMWTYTKYTAMQLFSRFLVTMYAFTVTCIFQGHIDTQPPVQRFPQLLLRSGVGPHRALCEGSTRALNLTFELLYLCTG